MSESFLERELRRRSSLSGSVPQELVEEWVDDDDSLPAAFLLHPAVRGHNESTATEADVRHVLDKKHLTLKSQVSSSDFAKLAARMHKRASSSMMSSSSGDGSPRRRRDALAGAEAEALDQLAALVAEPKWRTDDAVPAHFSPSLLCGSAEHAADLAALRTARVTAVLNVAPGACEDPVEAYEEYGIQYMELPAEDFEDYPLLELHLESAMRFVEEHVSKEEGICLVHCFAGVNRSATLCVALCMLRERLPLLDVAERCWKKRPFILSNASFRRQLVRCANAHGLLERKGDGYAANYPDVSN